MDKESKLAFLGIGSNIIIGILLIAFANPPEWVSLAAVAVFSVHFIVVLNSCG